VAPNPGGTQPCGSPLRIPPSPTQNSRATRPSLTSPSLTSPFLPPPLPPLPSQACAGLSYSFSVYSPLLKERLHLSQTQIATVGSAGNLGGYFGILSGAIYDQMQEYPRLGPRCGAERCSRTAASQSLSSSSPRPQPPAPRCAAAPRRPDARARAAGKRRQARRCRRLVLWLGSLCCCCGYLGLHLMAVGRAEGGYGALLLFAAAAGAPAAPAAPAPTSLLSLAAAPSARRPGRAGWRRVARPAAWTCACSGSSGEPPGQRGPAAPLHPAAQATRARGWTPPRW
jgi:hypothetical protein